MAIAKLNITCTECGHTFEHRKSCYNRREADSYEAWAAEHITICPDCRRKQQAQQKSTALASALEKYSFQLPALNGVSDKQIAYAQSVRERYLADHTSELKLYRSMMDKLANPEFCTKLQQWCEEKGISVEDAIQKTLADNNLTTIKLMLTSTSAREILDNK